MIATESNTNAIQPHDYFRTTIDFDAMARIPHYYGYTLADNDDATIRWQATMDGRYVASDYRGNEWSGNWKTGLSKVARMIREAIQNDF